MLPRRSELLDAVAERSAVRPTTLSSLPSAVVLKIYSLLPVDTRLRCREVCRAWRVALEERSLWTRLDLRNLSRSRLAATALDSLLRAAAARAGGGVIALDVVAGVSFEELERVAASNSGALRELRLSSDWFRNVQLDQDQVAALLHAAPLLKVLEASVKCGDLDLARRWLHNETPFASLRIRCLVFIMPPNQGAAGALALAAYIAAHVWLQELCLVCVDLSTDAALNCFVDLALTRQLDLMMFVACSLTPASAPALARLIGSLTLRRLAFVHERRLLDAPSAAVLGAALRGNHSLQHISLGDMGAWHLVGAEFANAIVGHPSLPSLGVFANKYDYAGASRTAAGAFIGEVVSANAPALLEMNLIDNELGDDGLAPLCAALCSNTHLQSLNCTRCGASEAFVRDTLLPAVHANTGLRMLKLEGLDFPSAREAEAFVKNRPHR